MQVLSYTKHNPPRAAVKPLGVFHTAPQYPNLTFFGEQITDNSFVLDTIQRSRFYRKCSRWLLKIAAYPSPLPQNFCSFFSTPHRLFMHKIILKFHLFQQSIFVIAFHRRINNLFINVYSVAVNLSNESESRAQKLYKSLLVETFVKAK